MSKRKVEFDLGADIGNIAGTSKERKMAENRRFKEKHSLDSDEEDDDKETGRYNVLDEDDIEGQEDTHIDYEEGQKFTSFNMRDEMDDGHFDKDGTFIFKKEKEIADGWMDNIDWVKVKELSKTEQQKQDNLFNSSDDSDEDDPSFDKNSIYEQILAYMKPGETVTKALKRLGGSKPTKSWQKPKKNEKQIEGVDKEAMLKLTGLADQLTQRGDYEIYSYTYEKFKFLTTQTVDVNKKREIPVGTNADDALDMFADGIDDKQDNAKPSSSTHEEKEEITVVDLDSEVCWFYKWKNTDDTEIHGPYTSTKMQEWVDSDFFKDGVFVRKAGTDGNFYSSRRIDFELYT